MGDRRSSIHQCCWTGWYHLATLDQPRVARTGERECRRDVEEPEAAVAAPWKTGQEQWTQLRVIVAVSRSFNQFLSILLLVFLLLVLFVLLAKTQ